MTFYYVNGDSAAATLNLYAGDQLFVTAKGSLLGGSTFQISAPVVLNGNDAALTIAGTIYAPGLDSFIAFAGIHGYGVSGTSINVNQTGLIAGQVGIGLANVAKTSISNAGEISAVSRAIDVAGDATTLANHGLIHASDMEAIYLKGAQARVVNDGDIGSALGMGLSVTGDLMDLANHGSIISGANSAVSLSGSGALVNTGTLSGTYGVNLGLINGASFHVTNTGTIQGDAFGLYAYTLAGSSLLLDNAGTIIGNIKTEWGNETYNGASGSVTGYVVLGEGDDQAIGGAGGESLYGGGGNDTVLGNGGNDLLIGNAGNDEIDGGDGNDTVTGGSGADDLTGGAGIDLLSYKGSAQGVSVNLATGEAVGGDAQGDAFSGFEQLQGSDQDDWLVGSSAGDSIWGGGGMDLIEGGAGADALRGGDGQDVLVGGAGRDVLFGGAGPDIFRFEAIADSGKTVATRDVIRDFEQGADMIALNLIDASTAPGDQAFAWRGGLGFTGKGIAEVRFTQSNGDTVVQLDIDGDKVVDSAICIKGLFTLTADDFYL